MVLSVKIKLLYLKVWYHAKWVKRILGHIEPFLKFVGNIFVDLLVEGHVVEVHLYTLTTQTYMQNLSELVTFP